MVGSNGTAPAPKAAFSRETRPAVVIVLGMVPADPRDPEPRSDAVLWRPGGLSGSPTWASTVMFMCCGAGSSIRAPRLRRARERADAAVAAGAEHPEAGAGALPPSSSVGPNRLAGGSSDAAYTRKSGVVAAGAAGEGAGDELEVEGPEPVEFPEPVGAGASAAVGWGRSARTASPRIGRSASASAGASSVAGFRYCCTAMTSSGTRIGVAIIIAQANQYPCETTR